MDTVTYKSEKIVYYVVNFFIVLFFILFLLYHINKWNFSGNLSSCTWKEFFGSYCPFCGGTRSLDALLHGKLITSFLLHPLPLCMIFFFLTYYIPATYTFIIKRNGNIYYHFQKKFLIFLILVNILYMFLRDFLLRIFHYDLILEII